MSEKVEILKCYNPNNEVPMCRQCQRNKQSESNEYETFSLVKKFAGQYECSGYVSVRETERLF